MNFSDRIRAVAGEHPFSWAQEHGIQKGTMTVWLSGATPQRKSLQRLEQITGIPAAWWKSGEGPPPERLEDEPGRPGSGDARAAIKEYAWRASEDDRDSACQEPPAPYPEDNLTYLANVFNQAARAFYARHGVTLIAPAYEAIEEPGEVSLMITKHCVRFSLSLCPKQAKGVVGVQGQVKAEPLQLVNGKEKLTLRFDCKPCEMHVVGKMKPAVAKLSRQALLAGQTAVPVKLFKNKATSPFGH